MHEIQDFLAMAQQAEKAAATAITPTARECWEVLAAEYRKLAQLPTQRLQPAQESQSP